MKAIFTLKMELKISDNKLQMISLYELSAEVVYKCFIRRNIEIDIKILPNSAVFYLIRQSLTNNENELENENNCKYECLWNMCKKMDLIMWIRLLKYEYYRPEMMQFYQKLIDNKYPIGQKITSIFKDICLNCVNGNKEYIMKSINYGLIIGTFLSEASWYAESEQILFETKKLTEMLPKNISSIKLKLECCHRLFHTLIMYFKFDDAEALINEIMSLILDLKKYDEYQNYALLYTEFSRYNFFKNDYEESHKWIKKAINCLHERTAISTQIQVLRQASKVHIVKRDFNKAKFFIHQALARAEQHYGSGYYKSVGLLLDFAFYLLNSDNIEQSVAIYEEAYQLRTKMFGSEKNNLHIAIAEEDLAYALYVQEYNNGYFDVAMDHAQQAIATMKEILPEGNLMLCSANRVKALILEEQALDSYQNSEEKKILVNEMLMEAEKLHKKALSLTKHIFGEENILTAKHYGNLGRLYQSMRKFEDAEEMHLKAIEIKERILGVDDYEVGLSIGHLACLYNYHMYKYTKAEVLYHRSININLKLFSPSYSGLEYDYRGLIHVYEHLGDNQQFLKFSHKLRQWTALRNKCVSKVIGPDFYKIISIAPLENIITMFSTSFSKE